MELGPNYISVIFTGWTDKTWGKPEFRTQMPYLEPGVGAMIASKGESAVAMDVFRKNRCGAGLSSSPAKFRNWL